MTYVSCFYHAFQNQPKVRFPPQEIAISPPPPTRHHQDNGFGRANANMPPVRDPRAVGTFFTLLSMFPSLFFDRVLSHTLL